MKTNKSYKSLQNFFSKQNQENLIALCNCVLAERVDVIHSDTRVTLQWKNNLCTTQL